MTTKVYTRNTIFQHVQVLKTNRKKRNQYKEFVVEGVRNINEAVRNGWNVKSFLFSEGGLSDWARGLLQSVRTERNYRFSYELMRELSGKEDASELIAVVEMRDVSLSQICVPENPFIILFDRPSNKGNLGTIIRSCDAQGVNFLVITGHAVDLYDPHVIVSSMGSFFSLPIVRFSDYDSLWGMIDKIKKVHKDFRLIGSTAHRQRPVYEVDLSSPIMLLIGNETMGLSSVYKEKCDELCSIPMAEACIATSFNVSCAASIMMYEVMRQRRRRE